MLPGSSLRPSEGDFGVCLAVLGLPALALDAGVLAGIVPAGPRALPPPLLVLISTCEEARTTEEEKIFDLASQVKNNCPLNKDV